jgi:DNA-binding response OmpR family regulator
MSQALVMVAENDRTVLELLQIRLMVAGCDTCIARTGPMAMQSLKSMRPAALVLDLALPEMDGFAVLEALRLNARPVALPTLVTARRIAPEDVQRALRLGARDCLIKPFSGAQAVDRILRLLKKPVQPDAALA